MTFTKPAIDASNGHVTSVNNQIIHPGTKLTDLDVDLYKRKKYAQGNVSRTIAMTDGVDVSGTLYEVEAVFENGRIRKVFITISPPEHRNLSDQEWYAADRYGFHERWLRKQIGNTREFDWGHADVGEDKSANVMIGIFYK